MLNYANENVRFYCKFSIVYVTRSIKYVSQNALMQQTIKYTIAIKQHKKIPEKIPVSTTFLAQAGSISSSDGCLFEFRYVELAT